MSEPDAPKYEERLVERARNELVRRQRFKLIGVNDELVYWDEIMRAVWHRPRSPLNPEAGGLSPDASVSLPARYDDLELVLGARDEGRQKPELTELRVLDWSTWHEDVVTGDRWYEDCPPDWERTRGPMRYRRAGTRRDEAQRLTNRHGTRRKP